LILVKKVRKSQVKILDSPGSYDSGRINISAMEHAAAESRPGITCSEAAARLFEHGPNALPERTPPGLLRIFLSQFKSPFIYVLMVRQTSVQVSLGA
jgi:magnesium-transporting ATPase (P-type)